MLILNVKEAGNRMSDRGRVLERWIRWLLIGIVVVIAALVARWMMRERVAAKPLEPIQVVVRSLARKVASEYLSFAGRVEPIRDVLVAAEAGGRYTDMPVDVGASVEAGDVLIRIDDSLPKSALMRAEAEYTDAKRDFERTQKLAEKGAVSTSVLEAAATRMQFADAGLQDAKTMLARCVVRSPIQGRVEEKFVDVGEYAKDGDPVFRIANMSQAKVVVYVPEAEILDLNAGRSMIFTIGSIPETEFEGKVTFVAQAGDPVSHAFRMEMITDNSKGLLRGGMIADVVLKRSTHEPVIEIPFTAVLPRKGEHIVFVWEKGRAVRKTVRIHSLAGKNALISSGLEEGEMLIVEGQRFLQDGKRVLVKGPVQEQ